MPGPLDTAAIRGAGAPHLMGLTEWYLPLGRVGLLLALATVAGCGARAVDPSEVSGLFDRAVDCFGEPYVEARARLTHPGTNARAMLLRESQSPDVQRELTARILLGWMDHEDDFQVVADYASIAYRSKLRGHEVAQSMSSAGDCYDNAAVESFFASLKKECIHRRRFATRTEAYDAVANYIDNFYNPRRRHSTNDYLSPCTLSFKWPRPRRPELP
jgi:hypothetical protein